MKRWHVLKVLSGREGKVVEAIAAGRYEAGRVGRRMALPTGLKVGDVVQAPARSVTAVDAWAPEYDKQVFRRRNGVRIVTVRRRLFPAYVFVRFDHLVDSWAWLLAVHGVVGIVTVGEAPAPLPAKAVAEIHKIAGDAEAEAERPFAPGDRVMIERDLWFGHVGELLKLDDKGRGVVLLSIFGGLHRVTTAPGELVRV